MCSDKKTFNIQLDKEVHDELLLQMSEKRNTKVGQITQLIMEQQKRRLKKKKV